MYGRYNNANENKRGLQGFRRKLQLGIDYWRSDPYLLLGSLVLNQ